MRLLQTSLSFINEKKIKPLSVILLSFKSLQMQLSFQYIKYLRGKIPALAEELASDGF